jgi:putative restriction endonuclease
VENNGPDIVSNGLALSGTAHWMFDRGLISLSDNLEILISRRVNDQESVRVNQQGRSRSPADQVSGPPSSPFPSVASKLLLQAMMQTVG